MRLSVIAFLALVCQAMAFFDGPTECKLTPMGQEYIGKVKKTRSGILCQRWDSKTPHKQSKFNPSDSSYDTNYCRNPDGEPEGPWCYTTDPDKRWEYCDVPACENGCKMTPKGHNYLGSVNKTLNGLKCQQWDENSPHKPSPVNRDPANFPDGDSDRETNFCRNPDFSNKGPWCYTMDENTRWEYCDVPSCPNDQCKWTTRGNEYIGDIKTTKLGYKCQRWDEQTPHTHTRTDPEKFPLGEKDLHSRYCRNPDNSPEGPWCYTTDPDKRWDYCDVPECDKCEESDCSCPAGQYLKRVSGIQGACNCVCKDLDFCREEGCSNTCSNGYYVNPKKNCRTCSCNPNQDGTCNPEDAQCPCKCKNKSPRMVLRGSGDNERCTCKCRRKTVIAQP